MAHSTRRTGLSKGDKRRIGFAVAAPLVLAAALGKPGRAVRQFVRKKSLRRLRALKVSQGPKGGFIKALSRSPKFRIKQRRTDVLTAGLGRSLGR